MADLSCYIATFNCARKPVDIDHFAVNFFNALKSDLPPDLVVLSLQEIAPIGYSFLGGSLLLPYFNRFIAAVQSSAHQKFGKENEYATVIERNLGMTAIMVFARHEVEGKIRWLETGGVGVGLWEMGNKGAVGVRMGLQDGGEEAVVSFVAAHLAPMENAWERRNKDWQSICEGLMFERVATRVQRSRSTTSRGAESEPLLSTSGDAAADSTPNAGSLFDPVSYIFFAGDLNYRTSPASPQPGDETKWPQPVESDSDPHHYSHLLANDQLTRERKAGHTLHHLDEAPVKFPPTYKYSNAAQHHVASSTNSAARRLADGRINDRTFTKPSEEEDVWLWASHRQPSWCDRVLFLEAAAPKVKSYDALPVQPTSDHRPVALYCTIPLRPVQASFDPPFHVRSDWQERRAAAKRFEMLVGIAAYLGLTWEGEALLAGTIVGIVGGYLVLRALLGS